MSEEVFDQNTPFFISRYPDFVVGDWRQLDGQIAYSHAKTAQFGCFTLNTHLYAKGMHIFNSFFVIPLLIFFVFVMW